MVTFKTSEWEVTIKSKPEDRNTRNGLSSGCCNNWHFAVSWHVWDLAAASSHRLAAHPLLPTREISVLQSLY